MGAIQFANSIDLECTQSLDIGPKCVYYPDNDVEPEKYASVRRTGNRVTD
jgi:hypothetical protein